MTYNTGLQATTNGYTYWSMPESNSVTMTILNAGVDVGFGTTLGAGGPEAAQYPPADEYFPPGSLIRPQQFDAMRIKSHVANTPAQYSIAGRLDAPSNMGASFSPTYITIDPVTGAVSADFTGIVNALGLVLPTGAGASPAPANEITWERASDGAVTAIVSSTETGGGVNVSTVTAQAITPTVEAILNLSASAGGNNGQIEIDTGAGNSVISVNAGGHTAQILDSFRQSNFYQLPGGTPFHKLIDGGLSSCVFTGGSTANGIVNHRIGVVPDFAMAMGVGGGGLFFNIMPLGVIAQTTSQLTFTFQNSTGAATSGTLLFYWIAVGG